MLDSLSMPAPAPSGGASTSRAGAAPGIAVGTELTDSTTDSGTDMAPFALLLALQEALATLPMAPSGGGSASTPVVLGSGDGGERLPPGGNGLPSLPDAAAMPLATRALIAAAAVAAEAAFQAAAEPQAATSRGADGNATLLPAASATLSGSGAPTPSPLAAATPGAAWQALTPGAAGFEAALGQRLMWLVGNGVHDARLQVHPEHLGPIDLRLRLDGDQAQLSMTASHGLTRDALEQAVPRLREQLAEVGVQLAQADVGERLPRDARGNARESGAELPGAELDGDAEQPLLRPLAAPRLLDLFA